MQNLKSFILLIFLITVYSPDVAAEQQQKTQDPPIIREFQQHPTAYSLIGVGSFISFIGFSGLFAGGTNPDYYCDQERNKRAGESEQDCRSRVSKQNAKFYRNMAGVFGGGLLLAGTGGGLILWQNSRNDDSKITLSFTETQTVQVGYRLGL